jgi:hypothetical protein
MRHPTFFVFGVLVAVAAGVYAQSGGFPTRPRLTSLGVGVVAPATAGDVRASRLGVNTAPTGAAGNVELTTLNGIAPSDLARLSTTNTFANTASFNNTVTFALAGDGGVLGSSIYNSTIPQYTLYESDASAGSRSWSTSVNGNQLRDRVTNDAGDMVANFRTVTRSGITVDSIAYAATAFTINGTDVAPASGTFTASWDNACTTTPTATFDYQKLGNVVVVALVSVSAATCTSDTAQFETTGTPIPAALRPSTTARSPVFGDLTNNGLAVGGEFLMKTDGNIEIAMCTNGVSCLDGGWTGSGLKGINVQGTASGLHFAYMLGNP